ncbi:MAG: hypothetical protein C0497_10215 [Gemmatimonas sp.]|nr:hypothetical protein [Gemmatimonas sp.]
MNTRLHQFFKSLVHTGFLATLLVIGVAVTPREAKALSKVCAPDNRGCFYTRVDCSKVDIPKTWSCKKALRVAKPQKGDLLLRESGGRAAASVDGQRVFILSDHLEMQLSGTGKNADEFARLVLADRGAVSEDALRKMSTELGIPIAKASPRSR